MVEEERNKKEWWEKMVKKLEDYNLSNNEKHVVKQDFNDKEAEFYRKMYKVFKHFV